MAFARSISSWILRPQPPSSSPPTISRDSQQTMGTIINLFCVLNDEPADRAMAVAIEEGRYISDLKVLFREIRQLVLGAVDLAVYKVSVPAKNSAEMQRAFDRIDLVKDRLDPWDTIGETFPPPLPKHIQVIILTPGKLPSRTLAPLHPFWPLAPFPVSTLRC